MYIEKLSSILKKPIAMYSEKCNEHDFLLTCKLRKLCKIYHGPRQSFAKIAASFGVELTVLDARCQS